MTVFTLDCCPIEDIGVLPNGQLDVDFTKLAAVRHSYAENFIRDEIGLLLESQCLTVKW